MRDMSKLDHAKARDYHQYKIKKKGDYHSKMAKIHHANAIGGSSMMHKEGYIGAKGEKGRDYHNAGTFDKDTAYSHAKKHNGVVHKDPSGKYLVKHGRGKHVSEESTEEVQELNKSTLKRYSAKASADAANSARAADRGDPEAASRQDKRVRGVKLATKKLKELSPDTIKRYRDKAKDSKDSHKRIAHDYSTRTGDSKSDWTDKMAKVHSRAADNRSKGIARANKRIGEAIKLSPAQQAKVDARKAARDADGRSSVARKAKKANPAASKPTPKAVPPEKKRGPQDKADLHPVMQLRKVVDTGGKHKPVFHRGKTGSVSADDAHHALKLYSKLPAMGKRQLQIRIAKGGPDAVKKAADAHRSMSKDK